jgi:hypothetical protein
VFRGSLPASLRPHIVSTVRDWRTDEVWVGCSGNFTLERTIHGARPDIRLHSNDLQLYSCGIGSYLAGGDAGFQLTGQVLERHPWLAAPFAGDPAERLAALLQASRFAPYALRDGAYFHRQMDGYRRQWDTIHAKTVEKVRAASTRLASFTAGDVVDWIEQAPAGAGVAMYPPFAGAEKAFENDFADLEKLFTWPEPEFVALDPERYDRLYAAISERDEWLLGWNVRLEDGKWPEYLRGIARTTNRGMPVYVYSNSPARTVIGPAQRIERVPGKRIGPGDELTGPMRLVPLSDGQFAMLRSAYMNPHIRPGSADQAVGVKVGDHLIGVFALTRPRNFVDPHRVYLLSDFPVAPSDYPRLSKLVLYAALSVEAKRLMERLSNVQVTGLLTTAFAAKPVSMKYRGLFTLASRKPLDVSKESWGKGISADDPYYGQAWMLNYEADTGQWTLDEGLARWKKKHGKRAPSDAQAEGAA